VPPLRLHDVDDAQRVVSTIVTRSGLHLSYHDREELEQHLLAQMWELHLRYDASRGISFGAWAVTTLRKRVVDYQRSRFRTKWVFRDRVHVRERPQFVEFNDSVRARLDAAESTRTGDSSPDWDADCRRLHGERDRKRAEDLALLDLPPAA
jgi:DNA-directed RNA polymerase specialized sigma subunit